MSDISPLDRELSALAGPDTDAVDLAGAALVLARYTHPTDDMDSYLAHLDEMAADVRAAEENDHQAADGSAAARADLLAEIIYGEYRYSGDEDTYDDLDNANLMRVIDRRRGLPVALGILYIQTARAAGWHAEGLAFPGHFLVRLVGEDGDMVIIDPFHSGRSMEASDLRDLLKAIAGPEAELESKYYAPVTDRDILVRLINNIKTRRLESGHVDLALEAVRHLRLITPDDAHLLREAGLMNLRLGHLHAAIEDLDTYLARSPTATDRARITLVLDDLRSRLN